MSRPDWTGMAEYGPHGKKVLVVDDEKINLTVLRGFLKDMGHSAVLVDSGARALEVLDSSFDLVLLDIMMPGMDGFEVCRRIRRDHGQSDMPVIMVTGLSGKEDRLKSVEAGANDFISKPIDKTELRVRTASVLRVKESQDLIMGYQASLEEMVRVRTSALEVAVENMRSLQQATLKTHIESIHRLSAAAEFKDEDTHNHIVRMSEVAVILARNLGLHEGEVDLVRHASPMHDVGKIGIPDSILLKPGPLTPEEWTEMKRHTIYGARILGDSSSELLQAAEIIAMTHHEKFDGSGYPEGLAGEDIPLFGRITAVADVYDALTSRRPYKEPFSHQKSLEIMRQGRGSHFDPRILDIFLDNIDTVLDIKHTYAD